MAFASKSLTSGDLFGWREPVLPPGRTERLVDGVEHWVGEKARVVLASRPGPAARGAPGRGRPRRRHRPSRSPRRRRPAPSRSIERSLNGGFEGGPDGLARGHGPRAVRHRPRPPAQGDAPRRPARHPRAPDARRRRRPHRPRHRPLRADAPARRGRARSATTSSCRSRPATGSSSRSSRSTACRRYSGGEHPQLSRASAARLAADEAAGPQGRQRPRRGAPRAVRQARGRRGVRVRAGLAVAVRDGGVASRTRRRPTSCAPPIEVKVDMETRRPMDRLVVGDVGYGKTEVALRAAFKATQDGKQVAVLVPTTVLAGQHFADVQPALRGVPADRAAAVAVRVGRRSRRRRSRGSPTGRSTSSSAPTGCCRRTSRSGTSAWSSSTRSSGSASRPRSGSSSSGAPSTCSRCPRRRSRAR